jgi:hypothetical protein
MLTSCKFQDNILFISRYYLIFATVNRTTAQRQGNRNATQDDLTAKIRIKTDMAKRKRIILRHGEAKRLAKIAGVSEMTVTRALGWNADTPAENKVRELAKELNMIKKF